MSLGQLCCLQAKKAREQAALKNAQILCEELDAEKEKKESKRIAAVKKREKRKKNKKKKEQQVVKVGGIRERIKELRIYFL